ncbi:MAG: glycogen debranching enzyme N-terminal domain-containing protein, partial [Gemmatimonadales bacterium]
MDPRLLREWLEPDGLGGFASGTVGLIRTRRYHALLLSAETPPTCRYALVNGFDAWVESGRERAYLTPQHYAPDVLDLSAVVPVAGFSSEPWPAWTWRLENGSEIHCELFVKHGSAIAAMRWRATGGTPGGTLALRPFLSGRSAHARHSVNDSFRFDTTRNGECLHWKPYDSVPGITSLSNGEWNAEPLWYRDFMLEEERARGLDCVEDLAAPGVLRWDLSTGDGYWILADDVSGSAELRGSATAVYQHLRDSEQKRRVKFEEPLFRAADAYIVKRGDGRTIIAGYPWFTD